MSCIVRTHRVTKTYQGRDVVSNVSMNIKKGEIYGFLGPNGAGKTTIMKMLTNLIQPTSGEIEMFGEKLTPSSYSLLARMGTIIEQPIFYDRLTAQENLELHCEYMGYHNKKAIGEALDLVGLRGIERKSVKDFSLGMKQRLGIARAITVKPELLLLDEPINGLDPIGIKEIRDLFKKLSHEFGITILISSHILGEMELIADTIGVINHGVLLEEVSMERVRAQQSEFIEVVTDHANKAAYVLEETMHVSNFRIIDNRLIRIYQRGVSQQDITKAFVMNDVSVESVHKKHHSLEDYFMKLLNGGALHE
ncbi:ABC transporter ATP-binding protein [Paenibacillus alvei]|uniref:ABC transporter ATP-binding protein n=1 Tax=Paenibacillus alvei TaxID=44250 RepID=UPI0018CFDBCA|nr:ABC transporter ATP-binding protein [Paenibacillus alvei]MBG9735230.1 bacitracin ABC transporter ATP-binding protein [Paenibacillus alvei]MBG9743688.1 bacitracin ABC transporter ATP-binding protein [Paenibacillus alvei]MCY9580106.1 ABC transporter ATP-binding protein [Paenibacillus alvei]MCY9584281.1 ABC transporter ATP-binding protein [Paenibacillus alvei]